MIDACSWDNPGVNPFRGSDVAIALSHYAMPASTRTKLLDMLTHFQYTDMASITRDSIDGKQGHYRDMRDMHSGHGVQCHGPVSRAGWTTRVELGLVYCADSVCVIVPTICNNISLVTKNEGGGEMPPMADVDGIVLPVDFTPVDVVPEVADDSTIPSDSWAYAPEGAGMGYAGFGGGIGAGVGGSGCECAPPPICPPSGPIPAVPEPTGWLMFMGGLTALGFAKRKV